MKIGIIADTHIPANEEALPARVKQYFQGVDMIIHAGDLVEGSVIDELRRLCPRVEVVSGNMDSPSLQSQLPKKKTLRVEDIVIGVVHGWGAPREVPDAVRKEFQNVDVIVFGHSHQPLNERRGPVLLFNPGSATDTVFAPYRSVGILTVTGHTVHGEILRV